MLRAHRHHPQTGDGGFTLVEVMVTVGLLSILFAFAVGSWRNWTLAQDHKGAADGLQTVLRQTQMRAVTEGVSFCVSFDTAASTYTVSRYACDTPTQHVNGPFHVNDGRIQFADVEFQRPDGTYVDSVTFRPSGSAWPGSLTVTRPGSPVTYVVQVEGFTGRVSIS